MTRGVGEVEDFMAVRGLGIARLAAAIGVPAPELEEALASPDRYDRLIHRLETCLDRWDRSIAACREGMAILDEDFDGVWEAAFGERPGA